MVRTKLYLDLFLSKEFLNLLMMHKDLMKNIKIIVSESQRQPISRIILPIVLVKNLQIDTNL